MFARFVRNKAQSFIAVLLEVIADCLEAAFAPGNDSGEGSMGPKLLLSFNPKFLADLFVQLRDGSCDHAEKSLQSFFELCIKNKVDVIVIDRKIHYLDPVLAAVDSMILRMIFSNFENTMARETFAFSTTCVGFFESKGLATLR
jgi:hypothetical protein